MLHNEVQTCDEMLYYDYISNVLILVQKGSDPGRCEEVSYFDTTSNSALKQEETFLHKSINL